MSLCRPSSLLVLGLAACGGPTFQTHAPLSVLALSPADGATDVPRDAVQSACFSAPLQGGDAELARFSLTDAQGAAVAPLTTTLDGDGRCVRMAHGPLAAASDYVMHVAAGLRASDGTAPLVAPAQAHFRTGAP